MALINPISITYGDLLIGGGSNQRLLDGPYVIDKSYSSLRLVFDVILVAGSTGQLQALAEQLEDQFRQRDRDLVIAMDGSTWSYTSGETLLNVRASCVKSGDRRRDMGVSRAYTVTIEGDLPADDRNGLRDFEVNTDYTPSRQKIVTMRGVYTATEDGTATENYLAEFDAEASTILEALDGAAVWELADEQHTRDRNDALVQFTRQYVQLLADQSSGGRDDPQIRDHRIVFTDLSQHPGDSQQNVYRLRRVVGSYDCAIDIEETTNLQEVWRNRIKDHVSQLFSENFDPRVYAIEESRLSYDETSKRFSASVQFLYQKSQGSAVVEVSQSVAYREQRVIDYTPVHLQDEFAAEADVGWATLERVWSRTVVVVGNETPKRRLGQRAARGDAGPIPDMSGESSVDARNDGTVQRDGWNIVNSTSQVTQTWVGDPEEGRQVLLSTLTEQVTERFHRRPQTGTSAGGRR